MTQNSPNPMHLWFVYLFEQRMDKNGFVNCFECDKPIHESQKENTCLYSHLLSKKVYPQHAGNPDNVQICCADCHNLYERLPRRTKQYQAKLELLEKIKNGE